MRASSRHDPRRIQSSRRRTHLFGGGGNKHRSTTQPATAVSASTWRRFRAHSGVCVRYSGRSSHRLEAGSDVVRALAALRLEIRRHSSLSSNKHHSSTQPATTLASAWWQQFWARSGVCVGHPGRRGHRLEAGSDVVCALVARRSAEGCIFRRRRRVGDESIISELLPGVRSLVNLPLAVAA